MLLTIVAGARPNFIKIAPIIKAIEFAISDHRNISYRLIHTGQHYDKKMSGDFFDQLGIPMPHNNLACGSGTQAEQTASIMIKFEKELLQYRPNVVLVVGDVTSTMACAITAKKLCIDVAHVEAGIRSGDMLMPEEINRIVTDSICDHFFTTTEDASKTLMHQHSIGASIHFVGNTMIDTLYQNLHKLIQPNFWKKYNLTKGTFFLLTLHRPCNVDDPESLALILKNLKNATKGYSILFPIHPRTSKIIHDHKINTYDIILVDPQGYLEFIFLVKNSKCIITDSGGITEEATVLNIPCLTMRNNTERPETVYQGTNELVGNDFEKIHFYLKKIIRGNWKKSIIPKYWDGFASERIVAILLSKYNKKKNKVTIY